MQGKSYYDHIDSIIQKLDAAYDAVGGLRDCASTSEKKIFNDTRGAIGPIADAWRRFRDSIPSDRGEMIL